MISLPEMTGSGYWQWDELARTDFSHYPKPIKRLFTGAPDRLSAAMSWQDGHVYFFKGKQYWRLNKQLRVEKGYPRDIARNWMHCRPQVPATTAAGGGTPPSTSGPGHSVTGTTWAPTSLSTDTTWNSDHSPRDTSPGDVTPPEA
uniref:Matrix metallopeptidase 19 n=1 Tax=Pipistrellus kuhlii TaxID=59472 RepID=A0A7J7ZKG1_PIPKU|nr:matrix metallopeptidase 19 [Pipistrellus kuhlii]